MATKLITIGQASGLTVAFRFVLYESYEWPYKN